MSNINTPMEKIKSYHIIKSFLNKEQRKIIATMLNLTNEDLTRRLNGKEAEYEFLLRCYYLNMIDDVIAFEEGISRLTNTVTTDFLIITKSGRRLAIEVKSTDKEYWKISSKVYKTKKSFANLINAELYFAIRIRGHWIFLSGDYIENEKNYKIEVDSILHSEFSILGEKSFIIGDSIKILSIYNQDSIKSLGIENPDYGYLERYSVEIDMRKIIKVTSNSTENLFFSVVLEGIQDSASNHFQEIKSLGKGRTLIKEILKENCQFSLSHLLIAPIKHLMSDLNLTYDFSTYITEIVDSNNKITLTEQNVIYVLGFLCKAGVKIYEVKDKNLYDFKKVYDISTI